MRTSVQDLILRKLNEDECPLFDGILFGDGAIVLMEVRTYSRRSDAAHIRPLARSTVESFLEYNPDGWTSITALASLRREAAGLVLSCGEGSLGADGFVAVCEVNGLLRWIAFFQNSNPFTEIDLEDDNVIATSTLGHRWTFPLSQPERAHAINTISNEPGL